VKHLFDVACHPDEIAAALGRSRKRDPGLRLPGAMDGFEVAVRAILGQQVTVTAASTIAGRFAAAFGEPIETPHAALERLFPEAATIAALDAPTSRATASSRRVPARSWRSRAKWQRPPAPGPERAGGRDARGAGAIPGVGPGPRSTSPCARSRGPTRFRIPTSPW
jgi:AraC family transcriptional regulator of adaptative response / DNA-3-methyladenine glycosylase II